MEIEDIAKLDLYLKAKNGKTHILDVESLIIADNDSQAVTKLKDAAYRLNEIESLNVPSELKQTWQNLFTKQVKFSVSRAKNKRKVQNNSD